MNRRFFKKKLCPICKQKLLYYNDGKMICKICEIECTFDSDTGSIRFINFYGNREH